MIADVLTHSDLVIIKIFTLLLERQRDRESPHPLVHSPKSLQWPGLGLAGRRGRKLNPGLPHGEAGAQGLEPLLTAFPAVSQQQAASGMELWLNPATLM